MDNSYTAALIECLKFEAETDRSLRSDLLAYGVTPGWFKRFGGAYSSTESKSTRARLSVLKAEMVVASVV